MDCSLSGCSIYGILQARILEWVAVHFSRQSFQFKDQTWSPALKADSLPSAPPWKPAQYNSLKQCFLFFFFFFHDSVFDWAQLHSSLHVWLARVIHMAASTQACGSTARAGCPSRPRSHSWELVLAVTEHLFGFHVAFFSAVNKTCFLTWRLHFNKMKAEDNGPLKA